MSRLVRDPDDGNERAAKDDAISPGTGRDKKSKSANCPVIAAAHTKWRAGAERVRKRHASVPAMTNRMQPLTAASTTKLSTFTGRPLLPLQLALRGDPIRSSESYSVVRAALPRARLLIR